MMPLPRKKVILQQAGMERVIPNRWTEALGEELGLPLDSTRRLMGISGEGGAMPMNVSTFFPMARHGFLLDPGDPAIVPGQRQAVTYLATGLLGMAPQVLPPN
jgi:hypothetical protein